MRDLTDFELGWAVGILEGEGCFTIAYGCGRKDGTPKKKFVRIYVSMTDQDVVDRLGELLGGTVAGPHVRPSRPSHHKPTWQWGLSEKRGSREFMEKILPHLSERRQQRVQELLDMANDREGK